VESQSEKKNTGQSFKKKKVKVISNSGQSAKACSSATNSSASWFARGTHGEKTVGPNRIQFGAVEILTSSPSCQHPQTEKKKALSLSLGGEGGELEIRGFGGCRVTCDQSEEKKREKQTAV